MERQLPCRTVMRFGVGEFPFARIAAAGVLGTVLVSAALLVTATSRYPGGTAWDPTTRGADFWLNYVCDLERGSALDGEANPAAPIAQASVGVLAFGFLLLFISLPALLPRQPRLGRAVLVLGLAGALGTTSVAALPNDRFAALHIFTVLAAALPSLAATALAVVAMARARTVRRTTTIFGAVMLLVSLVDLGTYVLVELARWKAPPAEAILERVALIFVLGWMILVAHALGHPARRPGLRAAPRTAPRVAVDLPHGKASGFD